MANAKMEETGDINLDMDEMKIPIKEVKTNKTVKEGRKMENKDKDEEKPLINCLRNERIIVRYIPKQSGMVTNPKHILFGGMAENASKTYVVPRLSSGMYVDVLTNDEKRYLEHIMGMEDNALSIYKKTDNFWDDSNENGISRVTLNKQDNYLDLKDPEDYIKYKILLANKNFIAPSLKAWEDAPKATYRFVIISEGDENKSAVSNLTTTMMCYKAFGKIENDVDTLRAVLEIMDGRPTAPNVKLDFLQGEINKYIQSNGKLFLRVVNDELLPTKVLIKKSLENNLISKRGNFYYLTKDGSPLCDVNEDPTLNTAAAYLNAPKRQELKFSLEAKIK